MFTQTTAIEIKIFLDFITPHYILTANYNLNIFFKISSLIRSLLALDSSVRCTLI